jgi:hypothetical protein
MVLERAARSVSGWRGANIIASQRGRGKVLRYWKNLSTGNSFLERIVAFVIVYPMGIFNQLSNERPSTIRLCYTCD